MTPEKFRRLDEIYQHAIELPASERPAYLDQACAGDAELRAEAEGLLAQDAETDFLDEPAIRDAGTLLRLASADAVTDAPHGEWKPGERVGPYRIEAELGRGGMGVVYRAFRVDGAFQQEVALKVTRRSAAAPAVLDRFRRERQILALLNHPNIARILDGGATPDGRPFFVMELVSGENIAAYCAKRKLPLRKRLELFLQACAAVAHAHRFLIIHRDLKPANIMVTAEGTVKLLDFGIAKIFQPDFNDPAITRPAAGMMLTPDYASPEQVRGEPVTTGTDVYALGLILHEMLTGRRAQHVGTSSLSDVERVVCQEAPARMSETPLEGAAYPASSLRGDLDNIAAKTLRKDAPDRYATVNQLAEDIQRYLSGRPVTARSDSFLYHAGKFILRNKLAVSAGVAVTVSLAVGIGIAAWQARIARQHFEAVRSLANSLIHEIDPLVASVPGTTKARHLIMKRSLEYLDRVSQTRLSDPALLMELADAYQSIATLLGNRNRSNLGDYPGAMAAYRKALELRRRVEQIAPSEDNRIRLAQASARAARVYPNTDEALQLARGAMEVTQALMRQHPDNERFGQIHANSLFGMSYVHLARDEPELAIVTMAESRSLHEKSKGRNNLAVSDRYIALAHLRLRQPENAIDHAKRSLAVDLEWVKDHDFPRVRLDLSYNYELLARAHEMLDRVSEAWQMAIEAKKIREQLAQADDADHRAARALVDLDEVLGVLEIRRGDRAAGTARLERALDARKKQVAGAPDSSEDLYELGQSWLAAAAGFAHAGECQKSAEAQRQAQAVFEKAGAQSTLRTLEKLPRCGS